MRAKEHLLVAALAGGAAGCVVFYDTDPSPAAYSEDADVVEDTHDVLEEPDLGPDVFDTAPDLQVGDVEPDVVVVDTADAPDTPEDVSDDVSDTEPDLALDADSDPDSSADVDVAPDADSDADANADADADASSDASTDTEPDADVGADAVPDVEPDLPPAECPETFDLSEDADLDGVPWVCEQCPSIPDREPEYRDVDGDGVGDACQDADEDGVLDVGQRPVFALWTHAGEITDFNSFPRESAGHPDIVYSMPWIASEDGNSGLDNPLGRTIDFHLLVRAHLYIPTGGSYQFQVRSDDASVLTVDGVQVVENLGAHRMRGREGWIELAQGTSELELDYLQGRGSSGLELYWRRSEEDEFRLIEPHEYAYSDNCPDYFNPLQEDADRDGIGDPCDCLPPHDFVSFDPPPGLETHVCADSAWEDGGCVSIYVRNVTDSDLTWELPYEVDSEYGESPWEAVTYRRGGNSFYEGVERVRTLAPGERHRFGSCYSTEDGDDD